MFAKWYIAYQSIFFTIFLKNKYLNDKKKEGIALDGFKYIFIIVYRDRLARFDSGTTKARLEISHAVPAHGLHIRPKHDPIKLRSLRAVVSPEETTSPSCSSFE